MLNFLPKKNILGIGCIVYVIILVLFSVFGDRGLLSSQSLWMQKKRLQHNIQDLELSISQMQEEVYLFTHDDITVEGYARQQLGMHRDNELEILLP